jgi:hypothetical protein
VATDEAEFERAGLDGRAPLASEECAVRTGVGSGLPIDSGKADTGVGTGVDDGVEDALEGTAIPWYEPAVAAAAAAVGPLYTWPSSPGANVTAEQKPSDELMMSVKPSIDLATWPSKLAAN